MESSSVQTCSEVQWTAQCTAQADSKPATGCYSLEGCCSAHPCRLWCVLHPVLDPVLASDASDLFFRVFSLLLGNSGACDGQYVPVFSCKGEDHAREDNHEHGMQSLAEPDLPFTWSTTQRSV